MSAPPLAPAVRGTLQVAVQLRPLSVKERSAQESTVVAVDDNKITVTHPVSGKQDVFQFMHVFDQTQEDTGALDATETSRRQLLHGIAAQIAADNTQTVVAYGAAKSGQNKLLWEAPSQPPAVPPPPAPDAADAVPESNGDAPADTAPTAPEPSPAPGKRDTVGVVHQLFADIWAQCNSKPRFKVEIAHMAVEGEHVIDLLSTKSRAIVRVRESARGTVAEHLTKVTVNSVEHFQELIRTAHQSPSARHNKVLLVSVTTAADNKPVSAVTTTQLVVVDLAYVTEVKKTLKQGATSQTTMITTALFEKVMHAVGKGTSQPKAVLPFHEDQLLWLVKANLQPSSHITLLATVSPAAADYSHTLHTLSFASTLNPAQGGAAAPAPAGFTQTRIYNKDPVVTEQRMCVLCRTFPIEVAIVPCGHFAFCGTCADRLTGKCPACRTQIASKLRIRYCAALPEAPRSPTPGTATEKPTERPAARVAAKPGARTAKPQPASAAKPAEPKATAAKPAEPKPAAAVKKPVESRLTKPAPQAAKQPAKPAAAKPAGPQKPVAAKPGAQKPAAPKPAETAAPAVAREPAVAPEAKPDSQPAKESDTVVVEATAVDAVQETQQADTAAESPAKQPAETEVTSKPEEQAETPAVVTASTEQEAVPESQSVQAEESSPADAKDAAADTAQSPRTPGKETSQPAPPAETTTSPAAEPKPPAQSQEEQPQSQTPRQEQQPSATASPKHSEPVKAADSRRSSQVSAAERKQSVVADAQADEPAQQQPQTPKQEEKQEAQDQRRASQVSVPGRKQSVVDAAAGEPEQTQSPAQQEKKQSTPVSERRGSQMSIPSRKQSVAPTESQPTQSPSQKEKQPTPASERRGSQMATPSRKQSVVAAGSPQQTPSRKQSVAAQQSPQQEEKQTPTSEQRKQSVVAAAEPEQAQQQTPKQPEKKVVEQRRGSQIPTPGRKQSTVDATEPAQQQTPKQDEKRTPVQRSGSQIITPGRKQSTAPSDERRQSLAKKPSQASPKTPQKTPQKEADTTTPTTQDA